MEIRGQHNNPLILFVKYYDVVGYTPTAYAQSTEETVKNVAHDSTPPQNATDGFPYSVCPLQRSALETPAPYTPRPCVTARADCSAVTCATCTSSAT